MPARFSPPRPPAHRSTFILLASLRRFWQRLRPPAQYGAVFEHVLGTTLGVQVVAQTGGQFAQAQQALLAEIDRLELIFSRFRPESELNRWAASSGLVPVSTELGEVLQQAMYWQERSGGAFHPATEALSPLWKKAQDTGVAPAVHHVLAEMSRPLYTVRHTQQGWTATRLTPLPLGFNAFAKGFIADRACAAALAVPGVQSVVVNIGGDLRVMGPRSVRIEVADPATLADNAAPIASVEVRGQGVATSGQARRGFLVGGVWYSHVLDPRSGQPVSHVVSASVVAPTSADADVLATIFSVLEVPGSLELADRLPGVACLLIDAAGARHRSARWTELEAAPKRR